MTDKPKQWLYQDLIGNMSRFTFPVCRFVQLGYGRTEYFTWEDTITDPSVIALSFYSGWLSFSLVASTDADAYSSFSSLSSTPSHPICSSFILVLQPFMLRLYGWSAGVWGHIGIWQTRLSLKSIHSFLSLRALLLHRVELPQLHHRGDEGEILGGEEEPC